MRGTIGILLLIVGFGLLATNLYGEIQGMRVAEKIPNSKLRFDNDLTLSFEETMDRLERADAESELEFAGRVTNVIQGGLAHLNDWYGHHADEYSQRVPFSENFILHLVGRYSGLPQMQRYHFTDYRRSLERGIGVCGDHAMVLSQVLARENIESTLLSFRSGHVVLEVRGSNGESGVFDADFGVSLQGIDRHGLVNRELIADSYGAIPYSEAEVRALGNIYADGYVTFENTYEFMRKRYVFERVSYVMKWFLPISIGLFGFFLFFSLAQPQRSVALGLSSHASV